MEDVHQLEQLRIVQLLLEAVPAVPQVHRVEAVKLHPVHLGRVGYAGLKPGEVEAHHAEQGRKHRRHRQPALPPAEHPEGFVQQHPGREVTGHHEHDLPAAGEHGGDHAKGQPRAEGHAVLEHRAHGLDGHHVPRALQPPGAVEEERPHGEQQGRDGVYAHCPQAVKLQHPLAAGHLGGLVHPVPEGAYPLLQPHHRGEPFHHLMHAVREAGKAVIKRPEHNAQQLRHANDQEIDHGVKGGQGQKVPGEHGAEHRQGVEEEPLSARRRQPEAQPLPAHHAPRQLHQQGEQENHQVGHNQEGQPRQIVGEEQPLPPDGQSAEEVGRTGIIQVAEHRHGRQHPEYKGQLEGQLRRGLGHHVKGEVLHVACVMLVHLEKHQPVQGQHHQPDGEVRPPQGPEAADSLFENRPIKERCPGPHSPHLPFHR